MKGSRMLAALVAALAIAPAAHGAGSVVGKADDARQKAGAVRAYPSSQTIPPSGPVAGGGGASAAALNVAAGEREGFWAVASGAGRIAATIDRGSLGEIHAGLYFGHYVMFGSRAVPDALLEWDGSARDSERANQPVYVQVFVPQGTAPGVYRGSVDVYTDGKPNTIPFSVHVFPVSLPAPGAEGNFQTSFHVSPQTYTNKAASLYRYTRHDQRIEANTKLFAFLAAYRISPASWGFGAPNNRVGYTASPKWWLDSAGMMRRQVAAGPFQAMRIPISGNRASVGNRIAGIAYDEPNTWCDYLKSTRAFWAVNAWLTGTLQYLYALDEPDLRGQRLVAQQSKTLHECWEGGRSLMTGNPEPANSFLWNGKGGDDLDIWVVLSRRFYGRFTVPLEQKANRFRSREHFKSIEAVRARGAQVWTYTYTGPAGTPGFTAAEPLSNPRMFFLWNALEGTHGALYGQGTTNYKAGNPLGAVDREGEYVLLYPGDARGPIASARLEQIRDGIEDATLLAMLRRRKGAATVRKILGAKLFSIDAKGARLACNLGCDLKSSTTYSWPVWSSSVRTPGEIEAAKLAALNAF